MAWISQRTLMVILIGLGILAISTLTFSLPAHLRQVSRSGGLVGMGMMYGTLLAVFSILAFWTVLGTPRWAVRTGQGVVGFVAVVLTLLPGIDWNLRSLRMPGILAISGVILWLLVAVPLWLLTARRGIRLCHVNDHLPVVYGADQQFGIREVLIVTTTTAMLLAAVRWLIAIRPTVATGSTAEMVVLYIGMVVLNVFGVLPLLIAPLLRALHSQPR